MTAASRLLEADRQARWKLRKEQGTDKPRRSAWVVTTYQRFLSPDEVAVAHHLAGLWATAQGAKEMHDYVDGVQATDRHMAAVCDALRELAGFEAAARARVNPAAVRCMWAVAESEHASACARRMGFSVNSHGAVKKLLQITLIALSEYWEENKKEAQRWNAA